MAEIRNKLAMYLALVGGVLLLGVGLTGAATWETIQNFVGTIIGDHWALSLLFQILIIIASLGGLAVIIGGVLIGRGRTLPGKILIKLGTGVGLIGLLLAIALPGLQQENLRLALGTSAGVFGIILSILATLIAK